MKYLKDISWLLIAINVGSYLGWQLGSVLTDVMRGV